VHRYIFKDGYCIIILNELEYILKVRLHKLSTLHKDKNVNFRLLFAIIAHKVLCLRHNRHSHYHTSQLVPKISLRVFQKRLLATTVKLRASPPLGDGQLSAL
jgi:hypothetical protein